MIAHHRDLINAEPLMAVTDGTFLALLLALAFMVIASIGSDDQ